jgi:8-oxo-dGTP diphosphatase
VLIGQRAHPDRYYGQWEFPGGKIEPGENAIAALRRELHEELEVALDSARPLITITHDYPDRSVRLHVYEAGWHGEPRPHVHQNLRFVTSEELARFDMLEGNRPIATALRLPDYYLITDRRYALDQVLMALDAWCLRQRVFVQVREKDKTDAELIAFARAIGEHVHPAGGKVLINARADLVEAAGADGMHLNATQLRRLTSHPLPKNLWVGASCHDEEEFAFARSLGVDFAVLSPVQATTSHPGAEPLGWERFAALCVTANLPVYALGGVSAADLKRVRSCGGRGIAMVSAAWE